MSYTLRSKVITDNPFFSNSDKFTAFHQVEIKEKTKEEKTKINKKQIEPKIEPYNYVDPYYYGHAENNSPVMLTLCSPFEFKSKSDFFFRYWDAINAGWIHKKRTKPANTYELIPPEEFECSKWTFLRYFEQEFNGIKIVAPEYFWNQNIVQCGSLNYVMTDVK